MTFILTGMHLKRSTSVGTQWELQKKNILQHVVRVSDESNFNVIYNGRDLSDPIYKLIRENKILPRDHFAERSRAAALNF